MAAALAGDGGGGALRAVSGTAYAYLQIGGAVKIDGVLQTTNALLQEGTIRGAGTVDGNLTVGDWGVLEPGDSPGTLTITGNLATTGMLRIDLAGTGEGQYDRLAVNGAATLGGTLEVQLIDGFRPQAGDTFLILEAGEFIDDFQTFSRLDLGNGLWLLPVLDLNAGTYSLVTVAAVPEPATVVLLLAAGTAFLRPSRRREPKLGRS